MRVAVCSDVHGNLVALDAVLASVAAAGADEVWVLGDLVAHGPLPGATVQRLMALPTARFVRGNTDRYVLRGEVPPVLPSDPERRTLADHALLLEITASLSWTRGAITAAGGYDWLATLPLEQRVEQPDGTRVLIVHAAPGCDDGTGAQPQMTDRELLDAGFGDCDADLVFVGHTHIPLDRTVSGVRVVNPGSVSLPATEETRAMWILLEADEAGYSIERRFAAYDIGAVLDALYREHYPSPDWLRAKFQKAMR